MLVRNTSAESSSRWRTGSPVLALDVQCDGALPPVGQGEREIDAAPVRSDALGGQTAVGVPFGRLDVDDVGAPVGQQRSRHGDEDPLGEFDDPDSVKRLF